MKVVVNKCFGGFGLSLKAEKRLGELMGYPNVTFYKHVDGDFKKYTMVTDLEHRSIFVCAAKKNLGDVITNEELNENFFSSNRIERDNKFLIQVIEELGEKASGSLSKLEIVEIPDDVDWEINEYDGLEHVAEKHRTW